MLSSHASHGPPFTLHLYVALMLALNVNLVLQLSKTCATAVTCGGGGGGGAVVGGGWIVKRWSFNVFLVWGLLLSRAITCTWCFPTLRFLNVCPETPISGIWVFPALFYQIILLHGTGGSPSSLHRKFAGKLALKKTCTSFPVMWYRPVTESVCDAVHKHCVILLLIVCKTYYHCRVFHRISYPCFFLCMASHHFVVLDWYSLWHVADCQLHTYC